MDCDGGAGSGVFEGIDNIVDSWVGLQDTKCYIAVEDMPDLAQLIGRVGVTSSWIVHDSKPNERIPVTVRDISASF